MKANADAQTQEKVITVCSDAPRFERLLTPDEAAALLQVPMSWMYQHTRRRSGLTTGPTKATRWIRATVSVTAVQG